MKSTVSAASAASELAEMHPPFRRMLAEHGMPRIQAPNSDSARTNFESLVRSICYQQLAGKAAAAIHGRFLSLFGTEAPSPVAVAATPFDAMRSVGLSRAKTASILDLAEKIVAGTVTLEGIDRKSDDEIVRSLVTVRGIGEWTAQMFLIFQLQRLDVWPALDLAVRSGYAYLYDLPELPAVKGFTELGDPFRPYRTIAAWYCWRATESKKADRK